MPVPDGTNFKTGLSVTHPWWKIRGRGFAMAQNECVVGAAFAAAYPGGVAPGKTIYVSARNAAGWRERKRIPLVVTGIVSTGDAEDNAILVPLSVAQTLSGHPGKFRQLFVSALTKPADALSERDPKSLTPTEYDRWFCSPYISSISYQIEQVLPGTDVRAIRRVADTEGRILSHVSTLLWIVTLAALIAAALAVAATSATTVLQRRAEIGIMKAIGATNALVGGIFLAEQLMLAIVGGAVGFVLGVLLARVLGASVFGTPAAPRLVLLPVVLGLAALVAVAGQPDSLAARGAFRSRADSAGRVMFWRLLWQLLRGSRGRLAVALIAVISGAAVISALLNLDLDIERKLTQEFRMLGANLVISSGRSGREPTARDLRTSASIFVTPDVDGRAASCWAQSSAREQPMWSLPRRFSISWLATPNRPVVVAGTWLDEARKLEPTWKLERGMDHVARR